MKTEEKPLYTCYFVGNPPADVPYWPEAAKQLGINFELKYHGCCIETALDLGNGQQITDADLKTTEAEKDNAAAIDYYKKTIGEDWWEKLTQLAEELYENDEEAQAMPF